MNLTSSLITTVHQGLRIIATLSYNLGKKIAPSEAEYCEAINDQAQYLSEAQIMLSMLSVQEEAISQDDWEEEHFDTLNILAGKLVTIHGWAQQDIDRYMTRLVNSGPQGYVYEPKSDDWDE